MSAVETLVASLKLVAHPEGGFYRETYRSDELIPSTGLPDRYGGPRSFCTAIYFLIPGGRVSRLHRVKSDEIWHFYEGSAATLHLFSPDGRYEPVLLGPGGAYQALAPRNWWFGVDGVEDGSYALFGCTVAPGFEFADFELGEAADLAAIFPGHRSVIDRLLP